MPAEETKLRGKRQSRKTKYPLGDFPVELIYGVARNLAYLVSVNFADISGDQWASCFASAVGGENIASNLDMQDVALENAAWSTKTVTSPRPFNQPVVRLVLGRNSPTYSEDITDPTKNPQKTGNAVLNIWNGRVDRLVNDYDDCRLVVLIRNINLLQFTLFEYEITRFAIRDYKWSVNKNGNLVGRDTGGEHCFTWQPHGSQFTAIKKVPGSAVKFQIKRPPMIEIEHVLDGIGYDNSWVTILDSES